MNDMHLLAELEELLRTMPLTATLRQADTVNFEWFGRASSILEQWNSGKAAVFAINLALFQGNRGRDSSNAISPVMTTLYEARADLKMKTGLRVAAAVSGGHPFDYYDEVRKIIETAQTDLLFIDPFIEASFVTRYLPHIRANVNVRLLTREYLPKLIPSVEQFAQQNHMSIAVRRSESHDRYVLADVVNVVVA